MKTILSIFIMMLGVFQGFAQTSAELQKMADADQEERLSGDDWETINKNDSIRLAKATRFFNEGSLKTAQDYLNAGIIFQHGHDTIASAMAVKSFKKAIEMDSTSNRWWYAAAVDRDLMRREEPQIYGTQYISNNSTGGKLLRYKIDSTQVTDEEREYYNVETLAEQKEKERSLNLKKINSFYAESNSIEETSALIEKENSRARNSSCDVSEDAINSFGYQLMSQHKLEEALEVFKLNTKLYPKAANPWDSYGEILLKLGKEKEAIRAYKKSLKLDPENENARSIIATLTK